MPEYGSNVEISGLLIDADPDRARQLVAEILDSNYRRSQAAHPEWGLSGKYEVVEGPRGSFYEPPPERFFRRLWRIVRRRPAPTVRFVDTQQWGWYERVPE